MAGGDVLGDLAVNGFGAALDGVAEQRRSDRLTAMVGRVSADGHVGMVGVALGEGRSEPGGSGDEQHRAKAAHRIEDALGVVRWLHAEVFFVVLASHRQACSFECLGPAGGPAAAVVDGAYEQVEGMRVREKAIHAAVPCFLEECGDVVDIVAGLQHLFGVLRVEWIER